MRRILTIGTLSIALVLSGGVTTGVAANVGNRHGAFPEVISLPDGFRPEGISAGRGTSFYVGSLVDGAVYRGDIRTGRGSIFIPGVDGQAATGTEVDRRNRLWVAGGNTGAARVYDAKTGETLATFQFGAAPIFVNDVVVTAHAAYFTDSLNPVLYQVPIGRHGLLGAARTIALTGDLVYEAGFNVNGIEASPDGRALLVIQSNTGLLFAVAARTGVTREIPVDGGPLPNGDGLLRIGSTLYVVQNQLDRIAAVRLDHRYGSGRVTHVIENENFDVPTTVAAFGRWLYAVNARFGTPPTPDTTYTVVRAGLRAGHR